MSALLCGCVRSVQHDGAARVVYQLHLASVCDHVQELSAQVGDDAFDSRAAADEVRHREDTRQCGGLHAHTAVWTGRFDDDPCQLGELAEILIAGVNIYRCVDDELLAWKATHLALVHACKFWSDGKMSVHRETVRQHHLEVRQRLVKIAELARPRDETAWCDWTLEGMDEEVSYVLKL